MDKITSSLAEIGVVPMITLSSPQRDAVHLAGALIRGGVPAAEVTFRAEGAEHAIHAMRVEYPEMVVGAGTVLTVEQVDTAYAAGAQFIVSPGFSADIVKRCQQLELPVYPGCSTATEIQAALACGLRVLKFFPAAACGGVSAIQALSGPFPMVRFIPTGGISPENLKSYLSCKPVCACGGSYMAPARLIETGDWDRISELCRAARDTVLEVRNNG